MVEFLDKFEKRMEWIGVVESIVNRKGKNAKIESLFKENEMTNIIVSVLLFIMEKTLEENNQCDMQNIENFVEELIVHYYENKINRITIKDLASYMVKDILQNNGERLSYNAKNYSNNTTEKIPIRLIIDKIIVEKDSRKINYMLTNQGYDFLFRTREVDEEIKLTIEQLKLKEYVKRKKFTNAVKQSVELITYVRQKKKEIENFILSIRQNIFSIDIDEYEKLIKSTYSMLQDEYNTMNDIQKMIQQANDKIKEELESKKLLDDKLIKAREEIQDIQQNLGIAISEQRDLIINRYNLSDMYMETVRKSFEYSFEKRFEFEETILEPLEKFNGILDDSMQLLKPLFMPEHSKLLGIEHIFDQQMIFKETEESEEFLVNTEKFDDKIEKNRIENISNINLKIVETIMKEVILHKKIKLSQIIENLKVKNIQEYIELSKNRTFFSIAFRLYDLEEIKINEFYTNREKILLGATEEFNMEYCLAKLENVIGGINDILILKIYKAEKEIRETIEYKDDDFLVKEEIIMSDLIFEVMN